jgi:hypothetical protein
MPNIAVDERTHKEAKSLSKTLGLTLGELVESSVQYFKKTGIDPSKADSESPHKVVKELEKRIGQVVAYIKSHEQEKLNPLLEQLVILSRRLEDVAKELPQSARMEEAIKIGNKNTDVLIESHKRQAALIKQLQDEIKKENAAAQSELVKIFKELQAGQTAVKEAIETKLGKKLFA